MEAEDLIDGDEALVGLADAAVGANPGEDRLHPGHRGADRVVAVHHHGHLLEASDSVLVEVGIRGRHQGEPRFSRHARTKLSVSSGVRLLE